MINFRDLALPNIVEKKILAMPSEQKSRVSARSCSKKFYRKPTTTLLQQLGGLLDVQKILFGLFFQTQKKFVVFVQLIRPMNWEWPVSLALVGCCRHRRRRCRRRRCRRRRCRRRRCRCLQPVPSFFSSLQRASSSATFSAQKEIFSSCSTVKNSIDLIVLHRMVSSMKKGRDSNP